MWCPNAVFLFVILSATLSTASPLATVTRDENLNNKCPILLNPRPTDTTARELLLRHQQRTKQSRSNASITRASDAPPPSSIFPARIVGGYRAPSSLAKYMAYIKGPNLEGGQLACMGVIIGDTTVLTTASCVAKMHQPAMQVSLSGASVTGERVVSVSRASVHGSYNATVDPHQADISVVHLAERIPPASKKISLNSHPLIPVPNSAVRVAGYGAIGRKKHANGTETDETISNQGQFLRIVDLPVVDYARCSALYGSFFSAESFTCAGYFHTDGCGACTFDLGAPIFQYGKDDNPVVVGMAKGPNFCGVAGYPIFALKVYPFLNWIDGELGPSEGVKRSAAAAQIRAPPEKEKSRPMAAIIGGAVGGAVLLLLISVVLTWFCLRRRKRKKNQAKIEEAQRQGASSSGAHVDFRDGGLGTNTGAPVAGANSDAGASGGSTRFPTGREPASVSGGVGGGKNNASVISRQPLASHVPPPAAPTAPASVSAKAPPEVPAQAPTQTPAQAPAQLPAQAPAQTPTQTPVGAAGSGGYAPRWNVPGSEVQNDGDLASTRAPTGWDLPPTWGN